MDFLTMLNNPVVYSATIAAMVSMVVPLLRGRWEARRQDSQATVDWQTSTLQESASMRSDLFGRVRHLEEEVARWQGVAAENAQALMDYKLERLEWDQKCQEILARYDRLLEVESELKERQQELERIIGVLTLHMRRNLGDGGNGGE